MPKAVIGAEGGGRVRSASPRGGPIAASESQSEVEERRARERKAQQDHDIAMMQERQAKQRSEGRRRAVEEEKNGAKFTLGGGKRGCANTQKDKT